jgi:hypothetical protein
MSALTALPARKNVSVALATPLPVVSSITRPAIDAAPAARSASARGETSGFAERLLLRRRLVEVPPGDDASEAVASSFGEGLGESARNTTNPRPTKTIAQTMAMTRARFRVTTADG